MKLLLVSLALAALAGAQTAPSPAPVKRAALATSTPAAEAKGRINRAAIATLEKGFDMTIRSARVNDPIGILGNTRGIYLDGYGMVFTAEVNLVANAVISPFKPGFTPQELVALREKKLDRVNVLKQSMRDMLMAAAKDLDSLPVNETVTVVISMTYFSWENSAGLPVQIMMQAPRSALLDARAGRPQVLEAALRVREN